MENESTENKYDQDFWDAHYGREGGNDVWSGNPNAQLVADISGLMPGSALDVGAGEGADSIWLAQQGWSVTGVDISPVALERARAHAASNGVEISFEQHDLREWAPTAGSFDLVSAHFMQLPSEMRIPLFESLARAVVPGGYLYLVGHSPADVANGWHAHYDSDMFFTADSVAAGLSPDGWEIKISDVRARASHHSDNHGTVIHDEILLAQRRA